MSEFRDNVVVLTGASSGIGRELAWQLAALGARLVLAARTTEALEEVAAECRQRGGEARVVTTDVGDPAACERLVGEALAAYGRLDTLIVNAGISMWSRFDELQDLSVLERLMRVNYLGSVYPTFYALPHLKASRGRIVGVSSLTGRTGVPTRSAYAATKHAMAGFFDSLRIELAGEGVSVTMVYPGFVQSDVRSRALGADGQPIGVSPVQEERVMTAQECARQIVVAAGRRRRELIMTARGKIGLWLKLVAPGWIDRIAARAIEKGR